MNPMKLFSIVILFVLYRYEATGVNVKIFIKKLKLFFGN